MNYNRAIELYFLRNYRAAYNEISNLERNEDWYCLYAMIAREVFNVPAVLSELDSNETPLNMKLIDILSDKITPEMELKNDIARLFLADKFYEKGDYQSSLQVLYSADNVEPMIGITYLRAINYLALNRLDLATTYHNALIQQQYDSSLTLLVNIFTSLVQGNEKDALNTVKEIAQHQSTEFVKELEATCLLANGRLLEAWDILRPMVSPTAKKAIIYNALSCLEILALRDDSYENEYQKFKKFIEEAQ